MAFKPEDNERFQGKVFMRDWLKMKYAIEGPEAMRAAIKDKLNGIALMSALLMSVACPLTFTDFSNHVDVSQYLIPRGTFHLYECHGLWRSLSAVQRRIGCIRFGYALRRDEHEGRFSLVGIEPSRIMQRSSKLFLCGSWTHHRRLLHRCIHRPWWKVGSVGSDCRNSTCGGSSSHLAATHNAQNFRIAWPEWFS